MRDAFFLAAALVLSVAVVCANDLRSGALAHIAATDQAALLGYRR